MKRHFVNTMTGVIEDVEMTAEEETEFEASRAAGPASPEVVPTLPDDLERALIAKGVITPADIARAKRGRPSR